jgi:hypothetical protein
MRSPPGAPTAVAGLSIWPAEACLISELAAELRQVDPGQWRRRTIILPTRRLQNWLVALLSAESRAFVPPRFFNFDEFVAHAARALPAVLLNDGEPPLGELLAKGPLEPLGDELLIAGLLRAGGYRHLRLGYEHEIRQLFSELSDGALISRGEDGAYARLRAFVASDYVHCEASLIGLHERIDELEALHAAYDEVCRRNAVASAAALRARLSRAVAAHAADGGPLGLEGDSIVYLVGFTSLAACHGPLLQVLSRRPEVSVWLSEAPAEIPPARSPLALLHAMLGGETTRRRPLARLSLAAESGVSRHVRLHRAPTPLSETATALALVRQAVAAGVPASQTAILITDDSAYGPLLRCLLPDASRQGLGGINLAVTTPLAQSALGAWLRSLFDVVVSREDTAAVLDFLTQAHTLEWLLRRLSPATAPTDRARRELKARLTHDICASGVDHSLYFLATSQRLEPLSRTACSLVHEALGPLKKLPPRGLGEWQKALAALLDEFGVLKESTGDLAAVDATAAPSPYLERSAQQAARAFLDAFAGAARQQAGSAPAAAGSRLALAEVVALIKDKMLAQEIRDVGDQLCGVQVLSVEEARYVPFRFVVILGATEGRFPQALPKDRLLDNSLKSRLGLPGWQVREAIEDTTFHLLLRRVPALEIFYPHKAGGQGGAESVRSRFIERLTLTGSVELVSHEADEATLGFLRVGPTPTDGLDMTARGAPGGVIPAALRAELAAPLSASALAKLLICPYRFLLDRLGAAPTRLPEADDARSEGDWLHEILEAFFSGAVASGGGRRRTVAPPLARELRWDEGEDQGAAASSAALPPFTAYVVERLTALTETLAPAHVKDSPVYLQLRHKAWPAFAAHLRRLYSPREWPGAVDGLREHSLADGRGALTIELPGMSAPLRIRGFVDAVDRTDSCIVVSDYKRKGVPPAAVARRGLEPQLWLYAYALTAQQQEGAGPSWSFSLKNAVLGYWSILNGRWEGLGAGAGALAAARAKGLVKERAKPLEAGEAAVQALWNWRLAALAHPDKALEPDPSQCGYCDFAGVCRRDDPQLGAAVGEKTELRRFLGGAFPDFSNGDGGDGGDGGGAGP